MLADLDPILGIFGRSGRPIGGDIGRFCGPSSGSGGWFLEAGGKKMVMLRKIKNGKAGEKRKEFGQILDRFVRRQELGLRSGWEPKWTTWVYPWSKLGAT